jgi:hypothetical protein
MKRTITPPELKQKSISQRVRSVLGKEYLVIGVEELFVIDDILNGGTRVKCDVKFGENTHTIEAEGKGVVDALFHGLKEALCPHYVSLEEVTFEDFGLGVDPTTRRTKEGTDVRVRIDVIVSNSRNANHHFYGEETSFNAAAVGAVFQAVEFYINCEIAVIKLSEWIAEAKVRNRTDLETQYVTALSEIVCSTSHAKSIIEWKKRTNYN